MSDLVTGPDGRARCAWGARAPEYLDYHDEEWGRPVRDADGLYERLCLEAFQSGLSWLTILRKRDSFRAAFAAGRKAFGMRSYLTIPHWLFSCCFFSDFATLVGGGGYLGRDPRAGAPAACTKVPGRARNAERPLATSCRRPIDERPQTPSIAPFRLRDALQRQQRRQVGAVEPHVRHRGERGLGVGRRRGRRPRPCRCRSPRRTTSRQQRTVEARFGAAAVAMLAG